jgi:hypothetical protein
MGIEAEFGSSAEIDKALEAAYDADKDILGENEITNLGESDQRQSDFLKQAASYKSQGKNAMVQGVLGAAAAGLGGFSEVSDKWKPKKPKDLQIMYA